MSEDLDDDALLGLDLGVRKCLELGELAVMELEQKKVCT